MRIVLVLLTCLTTVVTQAQTWQQLDDLPGPARDDAASFFWGGSVFVGTGRAVDFSLTTDWYRFDDFNEWSQISSLPASGRQYCTAFADEQYGYLFGGIDANGPLNELWRYDPFTDQWEQRASLPGPGRYASVALFDRYIVTGMMADGAPTNECWEYNAEQDSWTQRATMPGAPRHRAAENYGVVLGGADASFQALTDGYAYDPTNDTWSQAPDLPAALYGADATEGVFVGGASSSTDYSSATWILDGAAWSTTIAPDFPGGVRRGGVISRSGMADIIVIYYGTGVDLEQRHNDWWTFIYMDVRVGENRPESFRVLPNPATDLVRVDIPPLRTSPMLVLRDAVGREVHRGQAPASGWFSIAHLPPATYFMSIETSDIISIARPLVIH